MKRFLNVLLCAVLALILCCTALAKEDTSAQSEALAYLREHNIMAGDQNGEMLLERGLNRAELAVILARMTVSQEHLAVEEAFYARQCEFSDVPRWAQHFVGYCAANYLVAGYGNGLYGPYDQVTPAAACTVMLRCLEDAGNDWTYETACEKAVSMELVSADVLKGTEISRGDMAVLVYRTIRKMTGEILDQITETEDTAGDGGLTYNTDGSINIMSDGSQYIPQAGDVIRCDDGTNYTITDVSRYDKNMFASGPLGALPTPACDWSQLDQPELPDAEARHFRVGDSEYLFLRNLYETRRMLYTLYNAMGEDDATWSGDSAVRRGDGTPWVHVELTMPDELTPYTFWPWRDSEVNDFFHSRPAGTFYLEVWDVYKDGIFQRTEYNIRAK